MILGKVVGSVWGSVKAEGIEGYKILQVLPFSALPEEGKGEELVVTRDKSDLSLSSSVLLALDALQAGIGDVVMLATGTRVRDLVIGEGVPVKTVVIGIVDKAAIYRSLLEE